MPIDSLFIIGVILGAGFLAGELARRVRLPKVTGYIAAGIFLNPGVSHWLPADFVRNTDVITDVSLSFITFSVGGTLVLSQIRKLGKTILWVTFLEAELAALFVAVGFVLVSVWLGGERSWTGLVAAMPVALLLAALACPTDPTATLAVTHEYRARGDVGSTIMGVAAFDDVFGIVNYSLALAVAGHLLSPGETGRSPLLEPVITISGGVVLGVVFGSLLNVATRVFRKESEGSLIVVVFAALCLCYGIARKVGVDELLSTMSMGAVVANFNTRHERIFGILERYTEELIFVIFFTLSGMHLDLDYLGGAYGEIGLFVLLRASGKLAGTRLGASVAGAPSPVRRYAALGLVPQGGIVVGLALMIQSRSVFHDVAQSVMAIVIGATVIHELIGPPLARVAIRKGDGA